MSQALKANEKNEQQIKELQEELYERRKKEQNFFQLKSLYENLQVEYDSLKLSLESSERIRVQQKELITVLQRNNIMTSTDTSSIISNSNSSFKSSSTTIPSSSVSVNPSTNLPPPPSSTPSFLIKDINNHYDWLNNDAKKSLPPRPPSSSKSTKKVSLVTGTSKQNQPSKTLTKTVSTSSKQKNIAITKKNALNPKEKPSKLSTTTTTLTTSTNNNTTTAAAAPTKKKFIREHLSTKYKKKSSAPSVQSASSTTALHSNSFYTESSSNSRSLFDTSMDSDSLLNRTSYNFPSTTLSSSILSNDYANPKPTIPSYSKTANLNIEGLPLYHPNLANIEEDTELKKTEKKKKLKKKVTIKKNVSIKLNSNESNASTTSAPTSSVVPLKTKSSIIKNSSAKILYRAVPSPSTTFTRSKKN